ncbi:MULTISPECIES: antibiotic biosynthesis monooxygenase [unclassified Lentimicrobium]|uniref:antibiotic biosynthesis monooxygenase family protein n=1 Tax=unclassified Lentimicrobium TaxID=2677434 RepID=UPI001557D965|nr:MULTISPECIES: antibiotic biosynthesis monooxygenase [unclassified Lentimicrobium]NPD44039.1 antibiotic biosynthesis monooxygenase [Lentimicrobium sp. S6]NPD86991.1 antibiotic biosynthesis monooxygenase [Lentimicrobium sp. L6]
MIAVLFEVYQKEEYRSEYLEIATQLKKKLETIEGFISIERFASLQDDSKILSLSFWQNEESIEQWRNLMEHREGQSKGRDHIFSDYRIRVAGVIRDYGMNRVEEARLTKNEHF